MNIIRKIRLNNLGYYQIKDNEKDSFEFIKTNLLNIKPVIFNKDIMYFNNDRKMIFQYNLDNNNLYTNDFIFNALENDYMYKDDDIYMILLNI